MAKTINRRSLSELRRKFAKNPDVALATWYFIEDSEHGFVNLRGVRLLILARNRINVMPGTVTRDDSGMQQILFSSTGLCRIKNGHRRGVIIEPTRLRVGESGLPTGLVKSLSNGTRSNSIRMSDDRDRRIVQRLCEAYEDAVDLGAIVPPTAYIRAKSDEDLTMRLTGEVTKKLMALDGYNKEFQMEDNFHNLIREFTIPADDPGYRLYPFDMVCGNGLVVMATNEEIPPLLIPLDKLKCEVPTIKVRI